MGAASKAVPFTPVIMLSAAKTRDLVDSAKFRRLNASLVVSAAASDRLLQSLGEGTSDYVLASREGTVAVRVRLAVESMEATDQQLGRGTAVIDWSRAVISNGGNRVSLSRTELRLLGCLVEADGDVVPRATLIGRAWPRDQVSPVERENALAVYMCMLRKRLAAVGLRSALETVRGHGYRVVL
jgi:two-component system, OmpR family, response regulator